MAMRGSTHLLVLAFFVVIGVNMLCSFHGVIAESCRGSAFSEIAKTCDKSILPIGPDVPPSPECCSAMRLANLPCLCELMLFTKEIERVISPKKAVNVARTCGVIIPIGLHCGSYKVPPPKA